jgi:hypothetical protein
MATLQTWHSKWNGGKKGRIVDYPATSGTVQVIDADIVKSVKEPLLLKAKGTWGQAGRRYLYDRKGKVYGVVLSSDNERDIHDILKNQVWQHTASSKQVMPGMTVYVVPSEPVIKTNPNAVGVKFKLA